MSGAQFLENSVSAHRSSFLNSLNFGAQVGILEAARSGNAPSSSECQTAMKCASSTREPGNPAVPEAALGVLWKIQHLMKYNEVPSELEFAPLTYMAGYLVFVCEQKVTIFIFRNCRNFKVIS